MKNKILIILFMITSIVLMILERKSLGNFSNRVFVTSLLIQFFSIINIFSAENKPYTLNKIVSLFVYFFYGIAPLLQFYNSSSFFGARTLREKEYFYMNILILVIFFFYQLFYRFYYNKKLKSSNIHFLNKLTLSKKMNSFQTSILIILSAFSFFMIFKANNFSIMSMFLRGGVLKESAVESTTSSLIIFRVFQPMSMICLLYYILSPNNNKIIITMLSIMTILTCFPLGMARFSAAALYIPLLLTVLPIMRKKNIFSLSVVGGLLIVFPFLNNFRNFNENTEIKVGMDMNMFLAGDFDSFQNFTLIVSDNIITYGRQLLGVLLFWMPRSVWSNKPIGSGAFTAQTENFYFENVSCNYFAEGYINFGFLGILFFLLFLSYFTARLDKFYWQGIHTYKKNYLHVIYLVLIGMLFFILRGDLMSSFAYTIGFMIAIIFVYKIMKITEKNEIITN